MHRTARRAIVQEHRAKHQATNKEACGVTPQARDRMLPRALFFLIAVAAVLVSVSSAPSCGTTCHTLAYCEGDESESYCTCQPGTIDVSDNEDGTDCSKEGYTVRFVGAFDLTPLDISTTSEVATLSADVASSYFCASDAEGYFARSVRLGMGRQPHNSSVPSVIEINCLYRNMPESINAEYAAVLDRLGTVRVQPAVYRWVLPTTDAPMEIPPTGLEVESVHFEPSCAESGCWVIKGTMTTGEVAHLLPSCATSGTDTGCAATRPSIPSTSSTLSSSHRLTLPTFSPREFCHTTTTTVLLSGLLHPRTIPALLRGTRLESAE
eukprot:837634-Rhodomonas_salina.1